MISQLLLRSGKPDRKFSNVVHDLFMSFIFLISWQDHLLEVINKSSRGEFKNRFLKVNHPFSGIHSALPAIIQLVNKFILQNLSVATIRYNFSVEKKTKNV